MYGPHLMLIILSPILAVAIFLAVAPYKLYSKYDKKCYYYDPRPHCQEIEYFHNSEYELRILTETGQENKILVLQKNYKKAQFWKKIWYTGEVWFGVILAILIVAIFVFGMWSICEPWSVTREIANWEEFVPMAQEIFDSANELERASIASKVVDYNTWLAEAKASQKLYGNWSSYYNIDLSQLDYIKLGG